MCISNVYKVKSIQNDIHSLLMFCSHGAGYADVSNRGHQRWLLWPSIVSPLVTNVLWFVCMGYMASQWFDIGPIMSEWIITCIQYVVEWKCMDQFDKVNCSSSVLSINFSNLGNSFVRLITSCCDNECFCLVMFISKDSNGNNEIHVLGLWF